MRRVRIAAGGYGYRENAKSPTKLILAGDFVCLPEEEAERLVNLGIAAYADFEKTPAPEPAPAKTRSWKRKEATERGGEGQ